MLALAVVQGRPLTPVTRVRTSLGSLGKPGLWTGLSSLF